MRVAVGGLARGNISRDMRRQCTHGLALPQLFDVVVPIFDAKASIAGPSPYKQPVILPHEFVGWMFENHPEKFDTHMLANNSGDAIEQFWRGFRPDDSLIWNHPCFAGAPDLNKICPISTHLDGVPVTRPGAGSVSLLVTSFTGSLSVGKSTENHFLFSAIPSNIVVKYPDKRGNATLELMLAVLNWSLAALCEGAYPATDLLGRAWEDVGDVHRASRGGSPIAGDWKFCHWQHRGDLDMAANELQLAHWASNLPCFRCQCRRFGELSFLDFRGDAAWIPSVFSDEDWTKPGSEFWNGPGVGMRTYALDPAHTLDKGVSQYTLGSLFKELVYGFELAPGTRTLVAQISVLQNLMKDFYKRTGCSEQIDRIQLKDFVNPKKPHSEYPVFTAGNMTKCRRLIPFGLELAKSFNSGSKHDRHRVAALESLDSMYTQMYKGPDFLSEAQSNQLIRTVDAFLAHQNWLHEDGAALGLPVYCRTIKSHMLWHMARDSKWYNPRLGWTYNDEDYVGRIAGLCRSVTRAVAPKNRAHKLLSKWLVAMSVCWSL